MPKNNSDTKQMTKMPAQILRLLFLTLLEAFHPAGAAWVALLAARGFSLAQVGLAEGVFHLTSLLFELPSGVLADVFGRKRSMVLSQAAAILSAVAMIGSDSLAGVCLAMVLSALGYNFTSGSREALAYETLERAGREGEYDRYAAADLALYRVGSAAGVLCAGLVLSLGYRRSYALDILVSGVGLGCALGLWEGRRPVPGGSALREMGRCLGESLNFLRENGGLLGLIFFNGAVGATATLLRFFLQARLTQRGLPAGLLGPALFLIGLGGVAGAWLVGRTRRWSFRRVCALSTLGVGACLGLSFLPGVWLPAVCGFAAALLDDFLEIRFDVYVNERVPSGQRSTLLSVCSLCFSLIMIVLSPLLGTLFSR